MVCYMFLEHLEWLYQLVIFFSPWDATIHLIVLCMGRALNYNQHHADICKMVCICVQVTEGGRYTQRENVR